MHFKIEIRTNLTHILVKTFIHMRLNDYTAMGKLAEEWDVHFCQVMLEF
jgi:hypothetical protein